MNIVIYDCEIKRGIPLRGEPPRPDIQYCDGWTDFSSMGVSVTGVYDYRTERYRVFCDDNVEEMFELFDDADLLVGFNNRAFDDRLLSATYPRFESIDTPCYDLLAEIWLAAGLAPRWGSPSTHGGYGLDAMCEKNFGLRKTGHGAQAPILWQQGRVGTVIDYCLNDIYLTKRLFDLALTGSIRSPKSGGWLHMRQPWGRTELSLSSIDVATMESVSQSPEDTALAAQNPPLDLDGHRRAEAEKIMSEGGDLLDWDNLVIEVEHRVHVDKMMVAVHNRDGLVVARLLALHEWSAPSLNDAFFNKDGPGIIKILQDHEKLYRDIGDSSGEVR